MAKKLKAIVTLQLPAGKATPAPPVGPALAQHGINIMGFVKEYNARTANRVGEIIPAEITVFTDGSFKFELKSPPTTFLIMKAAGVAKGSQKPNSDKVGKINRKQMIEIAEVKMSDMNTKNMESLLRQIEGTARSMGIDVVD
ncbi:MAG: 50S ribosomal protein L11 [Chloroflexi bacterium]|nr:50S ribosomal protein L11 [Chloroflexota bacterium]